MSFNSTNIERIRTAFANISNSKWEAGDAALEEVPTGTQGGDNDGTIGTMVLKLANEAGVSFDALEKYRKVSKSWPVDQRVSDVSWSVHRDLMGRSDRLDIIIAVKAANGGRCTQGLVKEFLAPKPAPTPEPQQQQPAAPSTEFGGNASSIVQMNQGSVRPAPTPPKQERPKRPSANELLYTEDERKEIAQNAKNAGEQLKANIKKALSHSVDDNSLPEDRWLDWLHDSVDNALNLKVFLSLKDDLAEEDVTEFGRHLSVLITLFRECSDLASARIEVTIPDTIEGLE